MRSTKLKAIAVSAALLALTALTSHAAVIRSWDDANQRGGDLFGATLTDFEYGHLAAALVADGHTILPGVSTLDAAALAGVDVFFHGTSSHIITAAEGSELSKFVADGGCVLIEVNSATSEQNAGNAILAALGLDAVMGPSTTGTNDPNAGLFSASTTSTTVGPHGDLRGLTYASSIAAIIAPGSATVVGTIGNAPTMVEYNGVLGGGSVLAVGDPYGFGLFTDPASGLYNANNAIAYRNFVAGCGQVNRPPDCGGAIALLEEIWPPNHKLVPVTIVNVTDPDGDAVEIEVTGITQDEVLNGQADGNTCPDAAIVSGDAWVRSERSGQGNGRVYEVSFTATDEHGESCDGTVTVCVPHDQRPSHFCVDDGQTYSSLGPCASLLSGDLEASPALRVLNSSAGQATIEFSLAQDGDVRIAVFDVAGRKVASVENGHRQAGTHQVSWSTASLGRGMYFYRLQTGGTTLTRSLLVR